jgi:hypothetical protein
LAHFLNLAMGCCFDKFDRWKHSFNCLRNGVYQRPGLVLVQFIYDYLYIRAKAFTVKDDLDYS